jgi:hypothetical protein
MTAHTPSTPQRLHVRRSGARALFLTALLSASAQGCEWVLGDLPHIRPADAGEAVIDVPDEGTAFDAGIATDGAPAIDDAGADSDARTEPADAAHDAELPADTGAPLDAGADCDAGTPYYADDDGDGFGRDATRVVACAPPSGAWSAVAGDCADDNPLVFPMQPKTFEEPYRVDGVTSYDYDCSGFEEGTDKQQAFLGCGLLSLLLCTGEGYAATMRTGLLINERCGSRVYTICGSVVAGTAFCNTTSEVRQEAYRCH